jgi:ABC-type polar amino acid transport system ATPase subunit
MDAIGHEDRDDAARNGDNGMTALGGTAALSRPRPDILLSARNISKSFGCREVLRGVSLEVTKGERVCLVGRSGSGKSTFLRCLNLLEPPTHGEIFVAGVSHAQWTHGVAESAPVGKELARHRAQVGMVFQHFELFPHLTAIDNVALGPRRVLRRSLQDASPAGILP